MARLCDPGNRRSETEERRSPDRNLEPVAAAKEAAVEESDRIETEGAREGGSTPRHHETRPEGSAEIEMLHGVRAASRYPPADWRARWTVVSVL